MANVSLRPAGVYSVVDVELMHGARTGQGVMQELELDATSFATDKLQNGQCAILVGNTVKKPTAIGNKVLLCYTECEIYEEGKGRETFAVERGKGSGARLIAINSYDTISTNACYYVDTEFATITALKTAITNGTVKAVPDTTGDWKLTATTTGAIIIGDVMAYKTLSNDRYGVQIRFQ